MISSISNISEWFLSVAMPFVSMREGVCIPTMPSEWMKYCPERSRGSKSILKLKNIAFWNMLHYCE